MRNIKRVRTTPLPPLCPVHHVAMLVGRVIGDKQYRYCRVEDCSESLQTLRRLPGEAILLSAESSEAELAHAETTAEPG